MSGIRAPRRPNGIWQYRLLPGTEESGAYAGHVLAHLEDGQEVAVPGPGLEAVVVPLRGGVAVGGLELTGRADVWDGPTDVAYLPPGEWRLRADRGPADVAIGLAPADGSGPARPIHVPAAAIAVEQRGQGATLREVRHLYEGDRPAQRLLVVEVITPSGHWSSFPPHRHDELEEFYYCEVAPRTRHGYLHVFDDDPAVPVDEALAARHGDLFLVRRGYHTAACPPGSTLYYLNIMAGTTRFWTPEFHPAYRDLVVGWDRAPIDRRR